MSDLRESIQTALGHCAGGNLAASAKALFETLGYQSERTAPWTLDSFLELAASSAKPLTAKDREELQKLNALHLIFQISDAEVSGTGDLFDSSGTVDAQRIESYLFFAVDLPPGHYTRGDITALARLLNKPLPMPAIVLFRHGEKDDPLLSLAILRRRLQKKDAARDVLEKATLIKDIRCAEPIRAHLEILNDFSLPRLREDEEITSFVKLHAAWEKKLDSYALSNTFYREIADWYFWAHHQVEDGTIRLPQHCDTEQERSLFLIRLLTRVIFCWFLVEKRLIPSRLFRTRHLAALLKDLSPQAPTYYHAILQNLFFGTLNMPPDQRGFREKKKDGQRYDGNYGITNLWRYGILFRDYDKAHNHSAAWEALAARVPFLNGGLFDCLDDKSGRKKDNFILDGFSDREDMGCHLPNDLFFGPERTVDLSRDYGEETAKTARSKKAKVRGLIEILSRYKFTIEENTPLEEEIALDPELLGKVFENLLASYNEDTRTTARKALGAFYTPREIVSYMVDEALKSYLKTSVAQTILSGSSVKPFNRDTPTQKSRRNLPHWSQADTTYWVTFRLADSLPQEKLKAWKEERDIWTKHHPEPWSDADWKEYHEHFGDRLESWLDAGEGECHLRRPDIRAIVERCLLHFDGQRYDLFDWVIMPNHVHLLIRPREGHALSKILKGLKGVSAKECNALLNRTGEPFWQDESFDHIVRSQAQFERFVRYIADNPAKAKLREGEFSESSTGNPACVSSANEKPQTGLSGLLSRQIDDLFSNKATLREIKPDTRDALIAAIGRVKILDPACGSGAFPMGALHRLVDLLQKLDPNNESWKRDRLAEARRYRDLLREAGAAQDEIAACDARIADIEKSFDTRFHALDFARKLYLIENSIYGVDIQPIATQIAKLRFFISLVVDQKVDAAAPNLGVRPLPNLETRLVAADTLIPIGKTQSDLFSADLDRLRAELADIRHQHFNARSPAAKRKWREADAAKRAEIAAMLEDSHALSKDTARQLAAWDPYDQNAHAPFFDSEWMFGLPVGKVRLEGKAPATLLGNLALINEAGGQTELTPSAPREIDSGFDVVIGNPPYIRIQTLKQKDPKLVAFFKNHYASAAKGNYDIYVVFIEAGLRLLKADGHLAYICPHKFFNADYGEPTRALISKGKHLRHIVHFGDEQVFFGATIYTCLLFLAKAGAEDCRFVKAHDLETWKTKLFGEDGRFAASGISSSDWNFTVGAPASVFEGLQKVPVKLGAITSRISQGIRTSANEIYVLDMLSVQRGNVTAYSKQLDEEVTVERKGLRLFLQGREIKPFSILASGKAAIIPYLLDGSRMTLVPFSELTKDVPRLADYLKRNRKALEAREDGRMKGQQWYGYIYPKNLDVMLEPKLVVPDIADRACFALDEDGQYAFTSGYGITFKDPKKHPLKFMLGLCNSHVLDFYWRRVSTPLRGGFFRYFTQFIEQLPVADGSQPQKELVIRLVDFLILLNRHFADTPTTQTTRDPLMLAYWERVLNGLVYELYFPEEVRGSLQEEGGRLKGSMFTLVEAADLPDVTALPEPDRLPRLRQKFEELHDGAHPLRLALDKLQTLDFVRVIEGNA